MARVEAIFRGESKRIKFTPTGNIPAGTFVVLDGIVGVTTSAVEANTEGELQIDGDYELQFASAQTFVTGQLILTTGVLKSGTEVTYVPVGFALEGGASVRSCRIKLAPFHITQHAKPYSATATYAVGDVVMNSSYFYVCKTAISTGESFTSSKWIKLGGAPSALSAKA